MSHHPPARRTNGAITDPRQRRPTFRERVEHIASHALREAIPEREIRRAVAEVALSFAAAHRAARDPSALEQCTDASIGACVAQAALTRIMPGGPNALAYLVPQRPRRGAPPELQYRINHRGLAAIAYEDAGLVILPVAVHLEDHLVQSMGEVIEHEYSGEEPQTLEDLRGVYVTIRRAQDGAVLHRPWVPVHIIRARAAMSRATYDGAPWQQWPASMAMGAAIRYLYARGAIPSSSRRLQQAMVEPAIVETTATVTQAATPTVHAPPPALPPPVEDPFIAATERHRDEGQREREAIQAEAATDEQPIEAATHPTDEPNGWADGPGL